MKCRCGYEICVVWGCWLLKQHTNTHNRQEEFDHRGDWH